MQQALLWTGTSEVQPLHAELSRHEVTEALSSAESTADYSLAQTGRKSSLLSRK